MGIPARGTAGGLREQFPADFISEAIDQTRGWFYSLLAISTLLFSDGVGEAEPRRCRRSRIPIRIPTAPASSWV